VLGWLCMAVTSVALVTSVTGIAYFARLNFCSTKSKTEEYKNHEDDLNQQLAKALKTIAKANLVAVCLIHIVFYLYEQERYNLKIRILVLSG